MTSRIGIILAIAALLSGLLLFSTERDTGFPLPERVGSALEDVRVSHSEDGTERWELTAERADLGADMKEAVLEGVLLELDIDGTLRVSGKEGHYRFADGALSLRNQVVMETLGWRLETELLRWDSKRERLWSDEPVTMETPNMSVRAAGLEVQIHEEVARLSDVTCTFRSL